MHEQCTFNIMHACRMIDHCCTCIIHALPGILLLIGLVSRGKWFCNSHDLLNTFINETVYCTFSGIHCCLILSLCIHLMPLSILYIIYSYVCRNCFHIHSGTNWTMDIIPLTRSVLECGFPTSPEETQSRKENQVHPCHYSSHCIIPSTCSSPASPH